jgi:uncharacterized DUF497 family protein
MEFEWHQAKDEANQLKHGISFLAAKQSLQALMSSLNLLRKTKNDGVPSDFWMADMLWLSLPGEKPECESSQ